MRKALLAACALALMMGASAPVVAQPVDGTPSAGTVSPQISALLAQFPGGGPALRAAVAQLVEAFPSLADEIVFLARNANSAQKEAIGAGLADAANYFAKCGSDFCRGAESRIRTAMNFADAGTRLGFILGEAPTLAQGIPGFYNAGATGGAAGAGVSATGAGASAAGGGANTTTGCPGSGASTPVISPSSPSQSNVTGC